MKGQLPFGLVTGLAILSAGASSFRPLLPQLQRETNVPILLPSDLEFFSQQRQRLYAEGRGAANGYRIDLGTAPNCRDVTACFFGYFGAERGGKPNPGKVVKPQSGRKSVHNLVINLLSFSNTQA